eukprot:TRINITY_DN27456_c0_g1_i2.p1 TRINITY_DN27456_c0_g1~~TRINITY_DN27456_c0_g1_i2.p1  ORF type:complete len:303 (+),score=42.03 TRINITY_DN27456_c0_g1_i2:305-1213(+)
MCAMGARIATRRCQNGASVPGKCIPPIMNGTIQWPMAVSIWKVGHPQLAAAVTDWRAGGSTGHTPNIEWVMHTSGTSQAHPWNNTMPKPGQIDPPGMPAGPDWVASRDLGWGAPKIAKVVKCSDIPRRFVYNTEELFSCDSMPNTSAPTSNVDEAYEAWRSLKGAWPPVKQCTDDLRALDRVLRQLSIQPLVGSNCSVAFHALQEILPGFDCDNSDTEPTMRHMCCSVCGSEPIPDVPPAPAPTPPQTRYSCGVCNHVYDAERDGGGQPFQELPDSWVCPICGAPKSAYVQTSSGEWAHVHE